MPGFSTKRLPMKIFLQTLYSRIGRGVGSFTSSEAKFQAKHHLPSAMKTMHKQKNSVRSRFCARETVLLACALNATNLYIEFVLN